jgi:hypothetical protein
MHTISQGKVKRSQTSKTNASTDAADLLKKKFLSTWPNYSAGSSIKNVVL